MLFLRFNQCRQLGQTLGNGLDLHYWTDPAPSPSPGSQSLAGMQLGRLCLQTPGNGGGAAGDAPSGRLGARGNAIGNPYAAMPWLDRATKSWGLHRISSPIRLWSEYRSLAKVSGLLPTARC